MKNYASIQNVIVDKSGEYPEMIIYGYVGQDYRFYDSDRKEESLTDIEFRKELRQLSAAYDRINIRLNGPGGSILHGNSMIAAIQDSKAEIHMYNDGLAASMLSGLFLSVPAEQRHMAINSMLMIHSPSNIVAGNAKDMRAAADLLDKWESTLINIASEALGMSKAETKEKYFDYEDHWIDYDEAVELGIVQSDEEYTAPDVIENVKNKTAEEIMAFYTRESNKEKSFFQRIAAAILPTKKSITNNSKTDIDMTKDDFQKSLDDKTLSLEAVTEVLNAQGYEITATATDPAPEPTHEPAPAPAATAPDMDAIKAAINEALEPLKTENAALKAQIEALGDAPAGTILKAPAAATGDDPLGEDDEEDTLKAFNDSMAKAAADRLTVPIK